MNIDTVILESWEKDRFYICTECNKKHMFPRHPTEEASYVEGFEVGIKWPDKWKHKPGGPFVYLCPASVRAHSVWIKGWEVGYKCKLDGKQNAKPTDPEFSFKRNITDLERRQRLQAINTQIDYLTKEINKAIKKRDELCLK